VILSVNPFDPKTVLLAKHAQHVVLVHFPIALFIAGVAFDIAAHWSKRQGLAEAAYLNLLVAALSTIPVLATGVLAWQYQLEGQRLKGVLLLQAVPDNPQSGAIYLYDREQQMFYFACFDQGRDDSLSVSEFEQLVTEYDLVSWTANPARLTTLNKPARA